MTRRRGFLLHEIESENHIDRKGLESMFVYLCIFFCLFARGQYQRTAPARKIRNSISLSFTACEIYNWINIHNALPNSSHFASASSSGPRHYAVKDLHLRICNHPKCSSILRPAVREPEKSDTFAFELWFAVSQT